MKIASFFFSLKGGGFKPVLLVNGNQDVGKFQQQKG
jgi:hypothetical protein